MKTKREHEDAKAAKIIARIRRLQAKLGLLKLNMAAFQRALRAASCLGALCALVFSAGCASTDGLLHTPFTGAAVEKAYRLAGDGGYLRQQTEAGGRWMNIVQLEALGLGPKALLALDGPALLDAQLKQASVFRSVGRTDEQIVRAYNAGGVAWGKVGDGALFTALASGLVAGVAELTKDDDGGGTSKTPAAAQTATADQAVQISGNGNTIAIEVMTP